MKICMFDSWRINPMVVLVLLLACCGLARAQKFESTTVQGNLKTRVRRVFINLTGDPKLTHRLWVFFDFELEDAGILLASTEADADVIISGEVTAQTDKQNLGLGMIRMQLTNNGSTQNTDYCASLSTDENADTFTQSGDMVAGIVREQYPKAQTVKLDSASDMTKSRPFADGLPQSLKTSGLTVVESLPADVVLRVNLEPQKVPVEENIVSYKIRGIARDGAVIAGTSGTGVLSARLADQPPALCPDRFYDLDWLSSGSPLFQIARRLSKDLRQQNARLSLSHERNAGTH